MYLLVILSLTIWTCQSQSTSARAVGSSLSVDFADLGTGNSKVDHVQSVNDAPPYQVIGDFNGDGHSDLAWADLYIGYEESDKRKDANFGKIFVLFGGEEDLASEPDFSTLSASDGITIMGPTELNTTCDYEDCFDKLYHKRLYAGDLNNDSISDLIVASPSSSVNKDGSNQDVNGRVDVIFGKSSGWNASMDLTDASTFDGYTFWPELTTSDYFGYSVHIGDLNGDEINDLAVMELLADEGTGAIYVLFGKSSGHANHTTISELDGTNGFVIESKDSFNEMTYAKLYGGDIDGDGIGDLVVYQPTSEHWTWSVISVVYGSSSFSSSISLDDLDGSNGFEVFYPSSGATGKEELTIGDFNGDSSQDLAFYANVISDDDLFQTVWVVFGNTSRPITSINVTDLNGANGYSLEGPQASIWGNWDLNSGDFNGDGVADLAFAMPSSIKAANSKDKLFIVFGSTKSLSVSTYNLNTEFLNGTNGLIVESDEDFEITRSRVGDYNKDGIADLFLFPLESEKFWVIHGRTDFPARADMDDESEFNGFGASTTTTTADSLLQTTAITMNADFDGDGYADILLNRRVESSDLFEYSTVAITVAPECPDGSLASSQKISHFILNDLVLDAATYYTLPPGCRPLYTNGKITYSWTCAQKDSGDACLNLEDNTVALSPSNAKQLKIDGNGLKPNQELEFSLELSHGGQTSDIMVEVSTKCKAELEDVSLPAGPITIDVTKSTDISLMSNARISLSQCENSTTGWSYSWSCTEKDTSEGCKDVNGDELSLDGDHSLTIPANAIEAAQDLVFGVTVSFDGQTKQHSVDARTVATAMEDKDDRNSSLRLGLGLGLGLGIPLLAIILFVVIKLKRQSASQNPPKLANSPSSSPMVTSNNVIVTVNSATEIK